MTVTCRPSLAILLLSDTGDSNDTSDTDGTSDTSDSNDIVI